MAEELLDDEEWRFVDGHVGADGVADGVWGYSFGYARGSDVPLDYVADGAGGERPVRAFSGWE